MDLNNIIDVSEKSKLNYELSNSFNYSFKLDGFQWENGESYFQAMKQKDNIEVFYKILNNQKPKECFKLGNNYKVDIEKWNKIKIHIMKKMLLEKFSNSIFLKNKLLETQNKKLIKIHKKDEFWGYNLITKKGLNIYGKLLEEVRNDIKINRKLEIQKLSIEKSISKDDLNKRQQILDFFRTIPENLIFKIRHLVPEGGCLNNCVFCSQYSKSISYSLNESNLKNVLSALKTFALEVAIKNNIINNKDIYNKSIKVLFPDGLLGYYKNNKKGIIFPYFDNDILSYQHLDLYIKIMDNDFNLKTRISTIGFNTNNEYLCKTNNYIAKELCNSIESFRISLTPYSIGYRDKKHKKYFLQDVSKTIKIYKNLIENEKLKVEVRQNMIPIESFVNIEKINDLDIISTNNYIFIGKLPNKAVLNYNNRKFDILNSSIFIKIQSSIINKFNYKNIVLKYLNKELDRKTFYIEKVKLYVYYNIDGQYFVIDPYITDDGFYGLHIYPKTEQRTKSGYINSERLLLNSIIKIKKKYNLNKNHNFINASENDIFEVKKDIIRRVNIYKNLDRDFYFFLKNKYLPFIDDLFKIFFLSDLKPATFFNKFFLIDTGDICNLGNGFKYYKGFASKKNIPLTIQHEMSFGHNGKLAQESEIYGLEIKENKILITRNDLSKINEKGQIIEYKEFDIGKLLENNIKDGIRKRIIVGAR